MKRILHIKFSKGIIIPLLLTLFLSSKLWGQQGTHICPMSLTLEQTQRILERNNQRVENNQSTSINTIKNIPVKIHIVRRADKSDNGFSPSQIYADISQANTTYTNVNFDFYQCGSINYIDNDDYFEEIIQSNDPTSREFLMAMEHRVCDALNVFYCPNPIANGGNTSWSSFPNNTNGKDWIIMFEGHSNNGSTFSHEIGHWFDLIHTHETASGYENVTRDSTDNCYNCLTTGDLLCDTPADLGINFTTNCGYNGTTTDVCGETYAPLNDNVMMYPASFTCRTNFTLEQIYRMQSAYQNDRTAIHNPTCPSSPCENISSSTNIYNGNEDAWYHWYVSKFSEAELFGGCFDYSNFGETVEVTRAEAVRALVLSRYGEVNCTFSGITDFPDVSSSHEDYKYIMKLKEEGFVSGNPSGYFNPNELINRAEAAKLLSLVFNIPQYSGSGINNDPNYLAFSDVAPSSGISTQWYDTYVERLANSFIKNGYLSAANLYYGEKPCQPLISGYQDGNFNPSDNIQRDEFATILDKVRRYVEDNNLLMFSLSNPIIYNTIGREYEYTNIPYGSIPSSNLTTVNYEINDNETLILDHGIEQDIYDNDHHFYWVSNGNITSLNSNHRKIEFSANQGTYSVFTWIGNENGKIIQKYITIDVCPSLSTCENGGTTPNYPNYPDIQFSTNTLSYDDIHITGYSQARYLTVTNNSNSSITLNADIFSGSDFNVESGNENTNISLPAGTSEEFNIRFDPNTTGLKTGQLRVRWGNNLENTQYISLAGTGISDSPLTIDAPWNIYVNAPQLNGFKVNFSADDLAVKHTIEYANNSSFSGSTLVDFIATHNTPSYRIIPPNFGQWYFRVKSENLALAIISPWSNPGSYYWEVDSSPIMYTENCTPTDDSTISGYNSVNLQYQAVGGNGNITYTIWFSNSGYPKNHPPIATNISATSHTIDDLLPNQTYSWIVEATDEDGDMDDSPTLNFDTPPNTGLFNCNLQLDGGVSTTNSFGVNINLTSNLPIEQLQHVRYSNDGVNWPTYWEQYNPNRSWNLTDYGGNTNYGIKTVYAELRDISDNVSSCTANITVQAGIPGFFYNNGKTFTSLRAARDERVSSEDPYIYVSPGVFDLTQEIDDDLYSFNGNNVGVALPEGTYLIGAGAEKTSIIWTGTSGYAGIALNDNCTIQGISFSYQNTARKTIYIGGNNIIITDCHIVDGGYPIYIDYQQGTYSNLQIQRCIFDGNDKDFDINYLTSCNFVNNVVANTNLWALDVSTGQDSIVIKNNIFYNNSYGVNYSGGNPQITHNTQYGGTLNDFPSGVNGNNANFPYFINPTLGNYSLNPSSSARNSGINIGLPYYENAPDRGAYEYLGKGILNVTSNVPNTTCQLIYVDGTTQTLTYPINLSNLEIGMYQITPNSIDGYYPPTPINVYVESNGTSVVNINYVQDNDGPEKVTLRINGGQYYTASDLVNLHIGGIDEIHGIGDSSMIQLSLDGINFNNPQLFQNKILGFDLSPSSNITTPGIYQIWLKLSDNNGNWSQATSASIIYKPDMKFVSFPVGDTLDYFDFYQLDPGTTILLGDGNYIVDNVQLPSGISIIGNNTNLQITNNFLNGDKGFVSGVHFISDSGYVGLNSGIIHCTFTNCIFDNLTDQIRSYNDTLIFNNSIFTNFNNSADSYIQNILGHLIVNNCVFDGGNANLTQVFRQRAIDLGTINSNSPTNEIIGSIFVNFTDNDYGSAAITAYIDIVNPPKPYIKSNAFYNCIDNFFDSSGYVESIDEENTNPSFQTGTYLLSSSSPIINSIQDNSLFFNHSEIYGSLGIEGGLNKNEVPSLNTSIYPNQGTIGDNFTFTSSGLDIETNNTLLQYAWDLNGDGILDILPSYNTSTTHQYNSFTTDSISFYVFDEHSCPKVIEMSNPLAPLATTVPNSPILSYPFNEVTLDMEDANIFEWDVVSGLGNSYEIEIATDITFNNIIYTLDSISSTNTLVPQLEYDNEYWWRVSAKNSIGASAWSTTWKINNIPNCDLANVSSVINILGINQFEVHVNFEGNNSYTITDGITSLNNQIQGNYTFGPYTIGTPVSITVADELASNCIEILNISNDGFTNCSCEITNTNDSGIGSIREAINCANISSGSDTITFNIPNLQAIELLSPLPQLVDDNTIIDAKTQPNYQIENIQLDGSNLSSANGLEIIGNDIEVHGLEIHSFIGNGILIDGGDNILIKENKTHDNTIDGIKATNNASNINIEGNVSINNLGYGIHLNNGCNNSVIGGLEANGNIVSGNAKTGIILFNNVSDVEIYGNIIGLAEDGSTTMSNGWHGIMIRNGSSNNTIGSTISGLGNTILNNELDGIAMAFSSIQNKVSGNEVACNGDGIDLGQDGASNPTSNNNKTAPIIITANQNSIIGTTLPLDNIEVFLVDNNDCPNQNCQGKYYLGSTVAGINGNWIFESLSPIQLGSRVVVTATDSNNNTSEFSSCSDLISSSGTSNLVIGTDSMQWYLVSSNVIPNENNLDILFQGTPIKNLRSINGNSWELGVPSFLNTLQTWNYTSPYWIRSSENYSLSIFGEDIPNSGVIPLTPNTFNFIPYHGTSNQTIEIALSSILPYVTEVRSSSGQVWNPLLVGTGLNTLQELEIGKGYIIYIQNTTDNVILDYQN